VAKLTRMGLIMTNISKQQIIHGYFDLYPTFVFTRFTLSLKTVSFWCNKE